MTSKHTIVKLALVAAVAVGFTACKDNSTSVQISKPQVQIGKTIDSDTLAGPLKGTLKANHTYYMTADVVVPAGDTLLMQSGSKIIVLNAAAGAAAAPQITLLGTFASLGTKANPNWITVPDAQRTYTNLPLGMWAGIQGDTGSGDLILKWTHVEYAGATARSGNNYGIFFQSINHNFILEDSWITGGKDDAIRVSGGHLSAMRNIWECAGASGGDALNIKSGTVGDIAYNLFIGVPTNGPKLSNKGGSSVQTNVNIYNNTIVNAGWRQTQTGRSGSTNIEEGARGTEFNNLIVNCKSGLRLFVKPLADTTHVYYNNQYYYGATSYIVSAPNGVGFYPDDGVQVRKSGDIAGTAKANDPQFVGYDVNKFVGRDSVYSWPTSFSYMAQDMTTVGSSDFHLKSTSPAAGKGFTGQAPVVIPMKAVPQGGDFGASTEGLGRDMGAFQLDGSGNQH